MTREEKQALADAAEARRKAELEADIAWNAEARKVDYPMSGDMALWRAVVGQAFDDATGRFIRDDTLSGYESNIEKQDSRHWLIHDDNDFDYVCGLADLEPDAVRARALDFENMGWDVSRAVRAA